ncbi:MAG: tRNA pseudouridine(55) synthase TruB [Ruminococcus sp.]|jgi:tRNA pseudouridine55 synthase|nr:tRNA pseudouridine(55) synthase TruB [Ruminococcus sp.]
MDGLESTGVICIDKPAGFTSFDVCAVVRKTLGIKRIGHTGTLDPSATGVLPILTGRATLACDILPDTDKAYEAEIAFGYATNTLDSDGEITEKTDKLITAEAFKAAVKHFTGQITQLPPMFSAVKIGGKRLYEIARSGGEVKRQPRTAAIYSFEIIFFDEEKQTAKIAVSCSKGTYIRTLIDDISRFCGGLGTMTSLRRTRANGFTLSDTITIETLRAGDFNLSPVEKLFLSLEKIILDDKIFSIYRNGGRVHTELSDGRVRVFHNEIFIGTGNINQSELRSEKYFVI